LGLIIATLALHWSSLLKPGRLTTRERLTMAIEDVQDGDLMSCTYYSLDEYADAAERRSTGYHASGYGDDWAGASFTDALALARSGWTEQLNAALDIAETAVEMCEREHEVMKFTEPVYDVCGDSVDIGRYLSGEPECMMDWPLQPTSAAGRVIVLCASMAYSAAVDAEVVQQRGQVIVALALALSRLGHNIELWSDQHCGNSVPDIETRVLVKGADDTLDPARIMFAYAHPAMLRRLGFAVGEGHPGRWSRHNKFMYGMPLPPRQNLPEGTIYLPELHSGNNVPDAHEQLKALLREVGLLAE
jgi:hypothetical protein